MPYELILASDADGRTVTCAVSGVLDLTAGAALIHLATAVTADTDTLVIDGAGVSAADGEGALAVAAARAAGHPTGRAFVLASASPALVDALDEAGMADLLLCRQS